MAKILEAHSPRAHEIFGSLVHEKPVPIVPSVPPRCFVFIFEGNQKKTITIGDGQTMGSALELQLKKRSLNLVDVSVCGLVSSSLSFQNRSLLKKLKQTCASSVAYRSSLVPCSCRVSTPLGVSNTYSWL